MDSNYFISSFPDSRVATFDVGVIGRKKHHIIGLLEIDVTDAKNMIKNQIRNGGQCSFMAWLLKTIGTTVADFKQVHAINTRGNRQVIFNDVDISFTVERVVNGVRVPLAAIIRDAGSRSLADIFQQLEDVKARNIDGRQDYVINDRKSNRRNLLFFRLPQRIRLLIWKYILKNPFSIKKNMGTVMVTNVGLAGNTSGWIIPKSIHNIAFGIGSVNKKPWVVDNKVEVRDIMSLTVLFDHDAVDGMPAAKFVARLTKNLQTGKWI
mgnify:FL=1